MDWMLDNEEFMSLVVQFCFTSRLGRFKIIKTFENWLIYP